MQILFRLRLITLSLFHNDFTEKMTGFANISFIKMCTFYRHYLNFSVTFCVQYRSEISGLRTRKTHAQFLRKRVLKNACFNTRMHAFARIWCACFLLLFTLIYGILLLLLSTKGKTKGSSNKHHWKYLRRQTNSRYVLGHAHGVGVQSLVIDKRPTVTQIFSYGLNVNESNPSHRFSLILACVPAVWVSSLLPG